MWLETPLADHDCTALHCFVSICSLFHSVTGRRRLTTIKSVTWTVFFSLSLSVSMARATHLSVISLKHAFYSTPKPQSGSHTPLAVSQTLRDSPRASTELGPVTSGQGETGSLTHASDSPLKWKTENQYVSSWISSDISFEVCLRGNVSVTPGESGYWKPEAEETIALDGKQSIPERENELERVQSSDRSCTWRLYSCLRGVGVVVSRFAV